MRLKGIIEFVLVIILCLGNNAKAQSNLVLNPSFEQHIQCPTQYSEIAYCNNWYDGALNSTCDYFSANNCTGNFAPPLIDFNGLLTWYQQPLSGKSFAGFIPYYGWPGGSPSYTEFLQGKFASSLVNGKIYYVEFYINAASQQKYFIHDISALITDTAGLVDHSNLQHYTPQIHPLPNKIYSDTTNWMRISGYYSAHGGENYITIGNYTPFGQELKDSIVSGSNEVYYFIDSVGVYEVMSWDAWSAGPDKTINVGDSVQIGNPCNDLSMFDWVTSTNSNTYVNDSTQSYIWSKPPQTTTYYVSKTQGSNVFKDTVTVFVNTVGIDKVTSVNKNVKFYPNPSNGILSVQYSLTQNTLLEISDINGDVVGRYNLSASLAELNISNNNLENGIYFYHVMGDKNFIYTGKIIIMK